MDVRLVSTIDSPEVLDYLRDKFETSQQCYMAVAYGSYSAFSELSDSFNKFLRKNGELKAVFDANSLITSPELILELTTIPGDSQCKIYSVLHRRKHPSVRSFHPKLFCFKHGNNCEFLIGSSNFTTGGISRNIEIGTILSCDVNEPIARSSYSLWNKLWFHEDVQTPSYTFLERYRKLWKESREKIETFQSSIEEEIAEISQLEEDSSYQEYNLLYLLGLICGRTKIEEDAPSRFEIILKTGERTPHDAPPGTIAAVGISDFQADQRLAFRRDAERITEDLHDWLRKTNQGTARCYKPEENDFVYHIIVDIEPNTPTWREVDRLLQEGIVERKRFYPGALPSAFVEVKDEKSKLGFIRGYYDVKGRISESDRDRGTGPLRISLSVSTKSSAFGGQLESAIVEMFDIENYHHLHGEDRNKESIIRIEAQELPIYLFTSAWQKIMHYDFAKYNVEKHGRASKFITW